MTQPVPNMQAALVKVVNGLGFLVPPWNSFFQQFGQPAPAIVTVTAPSPFTANANGTVIITAAGTVSLTRGLVTISLGTGQKIIPISVGDTVSWTAGATTIQFLGA